MKKDILRIIDANVNRTLEGLRVCEEVVRFIVKDASLTKGLKCIRHDLVSLVSDVSNNKPLLKYRDIEKDFGQHILVDSENKRDDIKHVFLANGSRVKESLRVLEEFVKLIDECRSSNFKNMRFKFYELEVKIFEKLESLCNSRQKNMRR